MKKVHNQRLRKVPKRGRPTLFQNAAHGNFCVYVNHQSNTAAFMGFFQHVLLTLCTVGFILFPDKTLGILGKKIRCAFGR